jgi:hypothetical protein
MPSGVFPAVEPAAPVHELLERLRPAVRAEVDRYDGQDVHVHAELRAARGPQGEPELRRFYWSTQRADPTHGFTARTLHCATDPESLRVHEFPADPVLTWLDDEDGPLRRDGRAERADILRYIPLRRVTFRLHDGAGLPASVVVKTKGPGGLQRAGVAFLAVNRAAERRPGMARVPRLLRLEPPRHALYLEDMPGRPLDAAVADLDLADAMAHLGALHRDLQQLDVRGLAERRTEHWLRESRRAAEGIALFVPSAADRARAVHDGLVRTAPPEKGMAFCQGDFLPGQVLCDPGGWSVIDFDDSHYADPLSEVAAMYTAIPRELGLSAEQAGQAREVYLEAYAAAAGEPFDPARWRWWLTLVRLTQLAKRLMKGRVEPGETAAVLDGLHRA